MLKFLNSSLGKKIVMSATGLFLIAFLSEHLYTNLLLLANDGGASYNEASHEMVRNIIIRIIEIGLFAGLFLHIFQSVRLTIENRRARPIGYKVLKTGETSKWYSRTMLITGSFIFFFLVVHLYKFFLPYRITGLEDHTISYLVKITFQNPLFVVFYVFSFTLLSFHLNHGFQSAFQTLGLNNKTYTPLLKLLGTLFALIMWLGYTAIPVLFYFGLAGNTIVK